MFSYFIQISSCILCIQFHFTLFALIHSGEFQAEQIAIRSAILNHPRIPDFELACKIPFISMNGLSVSNTTKLNIEIETDSLHLVFCSRVSKSAAARGLLDKL